MGGYEASNAVRPRLDAVYTLAAALLGAHPDEIALTESATVGWQRAVDALRLGRGDRVLVSRSGYVSCALQLLALERDRGVVVELLPNGDDGARRPRGAARGAGRRPDGPARGDAHPDVVGARRAGRGGRAPRARGRRHLPARRDAVRRAPARRRARDRLRPARHDRPQVPARPARHRAALRAQRSCSSASSRSPPTCAARPGPPTARGPWTRPPGASRRGRRRTHCASASASRSPRPRRSASRRSPSTSSRGARGCARRSRRSRASTLADPPAARGALVTFLVDGAEPRDVALALAERAVQLVSVPAGHGRWDLAGRDLAAVVRAAPHVYTSDGDLDALLEGVADIARPARARSNGRRAVAARPARGAHGRRRRRARGPRLRGRALAGRARPERHRPGAPPPRATTAAPRTARPG